MNAPTSTACGPHVSTPTFAEALHRPPETWAAWVALAEAAERRRQAHESAAAQRSGPCPCEGVDPFCETCVSFARHLDPQVRDRRRQVHAILDVLNGRVHQFWETHPTKFTRAQCAAFARLLRGRRETAGLSVGQLAARAVLGVPELQAIEAGRPYAGMDVPEPTTVLRLWWALGGGVVPPELAPGGADLLADLAARRVVAGLTQAGLARQVGITRQALHAIETGAAAPRPQVAARLRAALATSAVSPGRPQDQA